MKAAGVVLVVLGVLGLGVAGTNASQAPNVSYLIGSFLPGLVCLIVGLKLAQTKRSSQEDNTRSHSLKFSAILGMGCGFLLMLFGSAVSQGTESGVLLGLPIFFAGWAWEIWGCVNFMRWKGYSGWFGLFGYLLLPGLVILACFPNRRRRSLQMNRPAHTAEIEAVSDEDQRSGYRFLLAFMPLGVLIIILAGFLFSLHSNIGSAEWKEVAPPEIGFQAQMPGSPRLDQNIQDTPAGKIELHKFTVEPKGKKELFMIVSLRFPEDVSRNLGGTENLLALGRKDLLLSSHGQLKSERQIVVSGFSGLELEVLPPKGAIIKARIFATRNQVYQVSVHVPKARVTSGDVQKFFDSFKLSAESVAVPDRGGS